MIHRIGHIILALLVFISSAGFVLNMHYCQDELKSIAIFFEAEPCHQEKQVTHCPFHNHENQPEEQDSKGCCDDQSKLVKSEMDQYTQTNKVHNDYHPLPLYNFSRITSLESTSFVVQSPLYLIYKPPLIVCDVQVQLQTFLC